MTVNGTIDIFEPHMGILEVILYPWSTHTVIGTKIGVNPHGESISTNLPGVQINHSSLLLINKFIELSNDTLIVKN